ncbi:MAG: response regulator transcription factor [Gammaproteobacteria bacterium]
MPRLLISAVTADPNHPPGCAVCIVDDEPGVRQLLCTLCESAGLAAEAWDSAESFLNAYADEPIKARCLVLDFNLPGMSGLDLLSRLEAQGIRLPVLLISGVADTAVVVQALKLGIAGFYRKPFETQALLDRILAFVGRNRAASDTVRIRKRDYRSGFQPLS